MEEEILKVGDYVTQNKLYFKIWNSKPFYRKITKIKGDFIFFDGEVIVEVEINKQYNSYRFENQYDKKYLKKYNYIRKQKLLKIQYEQSKSRCSNICEE